MTNSLNQNGFVKCRVWYIETEINLVKCITLKANNFYVFFFLKFNTFSIGNPSGTNSIIYKYTVTVGGIQQLIWFNQIHWIPIKCLKFEVMNVIAKDNDKKTIKTPLKVPTTQKKNFWYSNKIQNVSSNKRQNKKQNKIKSDLPWPHGCISHS